MFNGMITVRDDDEIEKTHFAIKSLNLEVSYMAESEAPLILIANIEEESNEMQRIIVETKYPKDERYRLFKKLKYALTQNALIDLRVSYRYEQIGFLTEEDGTEAAIYKPNSYDIYLDSLSVEGFEE